MATRQAFANRWLKSAAITRSDIFGSDDSLRPVYTAQSALAEQIDVAAVGMVGKRYSPGGVSLLSVNPAGGSAHSTTNAASDEMYEAFRAMRSARTAIEAMACFDRVEPAVAASMPYWRITTQYVNSILGALGKRVEDIAYLYLVPFRTAGDAGSKMPSSYCDASYRLHLEPQLDLLQPALIVCVDRPSEAAARKWVAESGNGTRCEVFYFTRKRDAHAERRALLDELRAHYSEC